MKRSAAACKAWGSATARKALSFLRKAMPSPVQFVFDEAMAVQTVGGLKGKEAGHAHDHRSQDRIAEVEVVVSEAATLPGQDAVVGIGGRVLGGRGPEGQSPAPCFSE